MEASFKRTMPHSTIDRIDRVENGPVHEAFQQAAHTIKRQVGAAFDPARMMQMLFHGTDAVDMIINATFPSTALGHRRRYLLYPQHMHARTNVRTAKNPCTHLLAAAAAACGEGEGDV